MAGMGMIVALRGTGVGLLGETAHNGLKTVRGGFAGCGGLAKGGRGSGLPCSTFLSPPCFLYKASFSIGL
jgi:hypothetical protein